MRRRRRRQSAEAAFARLRDEISLRTAGSSAQVLVVTSARREEGRTSVAVGLAGAFGRVAASSLLVDFDLRNPSLHGLFGAAAAPGVSDLLRGEASLEAAVRAVDSGAISLLPAGSRSQEAAMLMTPSRLADLMDALRGRAPTVIVDSPPVESGIEAQALAAAADGIVLVVRADRTLEKDARNALARLLSPGKAKLLGVVLNASRRGAPTLGLAAAPALAPQAEEPAILESLPQGSERRSG